MPQYSPPFAAYLADIISSPAWHDDGVLKLYLYCISKASHNQYAWRGLVLQPGDLPLSERHAALDLDWSRSKLGRKLVQLNDSGLATVKSVPQTGTLVHILDWYRYAASSEQSGLNNRLAAFQNDASNKSSSYSPWYQNESSMVESGLEMTANWSQDYTRNSPTGIKMSPNPSKEKRLSSIPQAEPEGFTKIWLAYPVSRRTHREQAAALVAKALREGATIQAILDALEADRCSVSWNQENGKYIPGIVKWLQKETWHSYLGRDEPEEDDEKWESR